jgi:hypothetical protein
MFPAGPPSEALAVAESGERAGVLNIKTPDAAI